MSQEDSDDIKGKLALITGCTYAGLPCYQTHIELNRPTNQRGDWVCYSIILGGAWMSHRRPFSPGRTKGRRTSLESRKNGR